MQCKCKETLEAKLKEHVAKSLPEGYEDFDASLQGYGFGMETETMTMISIYQVPYKGQVMVPKKGGDGMKRRKIDTTIRAQYCPFCGKRAVPEGEEESSNA